MKGLLLGLIVLTSVLSWVAPAAAEAPLVFGVLNQQSPALTAERWNPILQVRALVEFLAERKRQPPISIVGGDFNAAFDSDEIRLLTGRRPPAIPGWVFLDAWDTAGDESPGYTMVKTNPNAAPLLLPNLRWDYIFVSWPSGPGGVGHPVRAEVVGSAARAGVVPSDHYAVLAELRY